MMNKTILYFDMDNVLVDFKSGIAAMPESVLAEYADDGKGKPHYDDIPGIFAHMTPVEGAVDAVKILSSKYDCYILSTSPWNNHTSLNDKLEWIKRYFDHTVPEVEIKRGETNCGNPFYKKVIFSHHKELCMRPKAWLIDDRTKNGTSDFGERHIHFLTERFPDWENVVSFLMEK